MKRLARVLALVAALLTAPPAASHEQGGRVMGVIESVAADRLVVKASDGHSVACAISAETQFFQEDSPARVEDARAGQRVVVHGRREGGTLKAERVKLGAAKAPR